MRNNFLKGAMNIPGCQMYFTVLFFFCTNSLYEEVTVCSYRYVMDHSTLHEYIHIKYILLIFLVTG